MYHVRAVREAEESGEGGIGEMSDGYHTFSGLYYQRMVLFAALVKAYKDKAWKSHRHEDGELCFGGGWFIVGIDTPDGSYTYHYEDKDWDRFDCQELPTAKHWDGHTEEDVTRLLSLPDVQPAVHGHWIWKHRHRGGFKKVSGVDAYGNEHTIIIDDRYEIDDPYCSECGLLNDSSSLKFCPNCGTDMGEAKT